jgi:hypothetical protein
MKRLAALLTALPLFGAVTFTASKALAEPYTTGTPYYVTSLTPSSDYYSSYNGWYYVGNQYYLWGGSYCPSSSYTPPSSTQLQLMSDSVINKKTVTVYYKTGPANYPCLTGVMVSNSTAATSTSSSATSTTPPEPPR